MYNKNKYSRPSRGYKDRSGRSGYQKREDGNLPNGMEMDIFSNPGRPVEEKKDDRFSQYVNRMATKDLPMSSIQVAADPYSGKIPGQTPYSIVARNNPITGGSYGGEQNLTGAGVEWYATSQESKFLKAFDSVSVEVQMNYRYLPIDPEDTDRGKGFIDTMIRTMSEAMSQTSATTFMAQPAMKYVVETPQPMGSSTAEDITINGELHHVYVHNSEVFYAIGILYQDVLQEVASVFNSYNTFVSLNGEMIRMSWEREVSAMNQLFSLVTKKASFRASWASLALTIVGEYFDYDWMIQSNMISSLSSRKTESYLDPLMEMRTYSSVPYTSTKRFTVYDQLGSDAGVIFDSSIFTTTFNDINGLTGNRAVTMDFFDICRQIKEMTTAANALRWARVGSVIVGNRDNEGEWIGVLYTDITPQIYLNALQNRIEALTTIITKFKKVVTDFRTILDVMNSVGMNNWRKGINLRVQRLDNVPVSYNKTLHDIIQMLFGGASSISWNKETQRWTSTTLWNKYLGIPEYDAKSGGSILSFSTKTIVGDPTSTDHLEKDYVPILFGTTLTGGSLITRVLRASMMNRLGGTVDISVQTMDESDQEANMILARLNPISKFARGIKIPTLKLNDSVDAATTSMAYFALENIFGLGAVVKGSVTDYALDSDYVCWFNYEVYDVRNAVVGYARANGVFRTSTDGGDLLGFKTIGL